MPQTSEGYTNATPLTVADFMERGMSREEAERKVAEMVFGHDFKTDAEGRPIEQGKGSPSQQTSQHKIAVAKELERQLLSNPMHF
jgi:hypothetical protein